MVLFDVDFLARLRLWDRLLAVLLVVFPLDFLVLGISFLHKKNRTKYIDSAVHLRKIHDRIQAIRSPKGDFSRGRFS